MNVVIGQKVEDGLFGAYREITISPIIVDKIETLTVTPTRVVIKMSAVGTDQSEETSDNQQVRFLRGSGVVDQIKKAGDEFVRTTNWRGHVVYQRMDASCQNNGPLKNVVSTGARFVRKFLPRNNAG